MTRDKGQIPVLVKEVPLLLNHGPEITKALTQLHRKLGEVVISRWSWLSHVVCDFGRKGEWVCAYMKGEAPAAYTPGVRGFVFKRSVTVMVEVEDGGALG